MDSADRLPVLIANVQELDALCRAWLGYDSAGVERLETELDRLRAIEDAARVAADMTVIPVGERTFGKVSVRVMGIRKVLRDALAAYDATELPVT
jgi:hypothetical protein